METRYAGVNTRFPTDNERLVLSAEKEMPLVIEATESTDRDFLQRFLAAHSTRILDDVAKYGAVLLRGFDIKSDEDFEQTVLSIQGLRGISEAFMSEEGRTHAGNLQFVLHTNSVYKTGGTLYLGGFHSENYYSTDVPAYISFCCHKPSLLGGETGLVNMEKIYQELSDDLKTKLEKNSFLAAKWLVSEVAERYQISPAAVVKLCKKFNLPILGEGENRFILMYKPSIFEDKRTARKSLQINLLEIASLNDELRKHFMNDYQGKTWFWHRFVWKLPMSVFKSIELLAVMGMSFFHSPKESLTIFRNRLRRNRAARRLPPFENASVGSCFNKQDVKDLAKLIRKYYCSSIWQKGDILLVDNTKVMHAGMPGSGSRLVRALICNPLDLNYSFKKPGSVQCGDSQTETLGYHMST